MPIKDKTMKHKLVKLRIPTNKETKMQEFLYNLRYYKIIENETFRFSITSF